MRSFYHILPLLAAGITINAYAHFDIGVKAQSFGGAFRAVADAEDIIFSNPAGLIKHRKTAADVFYQLAQRPRFHRLGIGIGDTNTSSWGMGLGYVAGIDAVKDRPLKHQAHLALAMPIVSDMFALGMSATYQYDQVSHEEHRHFFNLDGGFMINAPLGLGFAVVVDHLLEAKGREKPMGCAMAFAFDMAEITEAVPMVLALDWLMDNVQSDENLHHVFATGMQYKAFSLIPVRAGYKVEIQPGDHYLSLGSGIAGKNIALDGVYQQHLSIGKQRHFGVSLTMQI